LEFPAKIFTSVFCWLMVMDSHSAFYMLPYNIDGNTAPRHDRRDD
jgi:hypothetical protein